MPTWKIRNACHDCKYDLGEATITAETRMAAKSAYINEMAGKDNQKRLEFMRHPANHNRNDICEVVE